MKIVVDTNIVFSALLNSTGRIGTILFNSGGYFEFYSCKYLQKEMFSHFAKIQKHSKLSSNDLFELLNLIERRIFFVDEDLLPKETVVKALELVSDVDADDLAFVALNNHLNGLLWTGDKALIRGLKQKNYQPVVTTFELSMILEKQGYS